MRIALILALILCSPWPSLLRATVRSPEAQVQLCLRQQRPVWHRVFFVRLRGMRCLSDDTTIDHDTDMDMDVDMDVDMV